MERAFPQQSGAPDTPAQPWQGLIRSPLSTAKISDLITLHITVVRKYFGASIARSWSRRDPGHVGIDLQLCLRAWSNHSVGSNFAFCSTEQGSQLLESDCDLPNSLCHYRQLCIWTGVLLVSRMIYKSYQAVYLSTPQLNIHSIDHIGRTRSEFYITWSALLAFFVVLCCSNWANWYYGPLTQLGWCVIFLINVNRTIAVLQVEEPWSMSDWVYAEIVHSFWCTADPRPSQISSIKRPSRTCHTLQQTPQQLSKPSRHSTSTQTTQIYLSKMHFSSALLVLASAFIVGSNALNMSVFLSSFPFHRKIQPCIIYYHPHTNWACPPSFAAETDSAAQSSRSCTDPCRLQRRILPSYHLGGRGSRVRC